MMFVGLLVMKCLSVSIQSGQSRPTTTNINSSEPLYNPFTASVKILLMICILEHVFQINKKI